MQFAQTFVFLSLQIFPTKQEIHQTQALNECLREHWADIKKRFCTIPVNGGSCVASETFGSQPDACDEDRTNRSKCHLKCFSADVFNSDGVRVGSPSTELTWSSNRSEEYEAFYREMQSEKEEKKAELPDLSRVCHKKMCLIKHEHGECCLAAKELYGPVESCQQDRDCNGPLKCLFVNPEVGEKTLEKFESFTEDRRQAWVAFRKGYVTSALVEAQMIAFWSTIVIMALITVILKVALSKILSTRSRRTSRQVISRRESSTTRKQEDEKEEARVKAMKPEGKEE